LLSEGFTMTDGSIELLNSEIGELHRAHDMQKKTAQSDALGMAARGPESANLPAAGAEGTSGAQAAGTRRHRVGRVNITGYFDPAVKQSLRLIQAKYPDRTVQDLLTEALNDLFCKYSVPQTAHIQK
jgi:hypothetical protein